jgi:hypothetical protein
VEAVYKRESSHGSSLQKREFTWKHFLNVYMGIDLALEVKSFIGSLSLRRILVRGPAKGNLVLPLVATIGITGREREGSSANRRNNKEKFERLCIAKLTRQGG